VSCELRPPTAGLTEDLIRGWTRSARGSQDDRPPVAARGERGQP